MQLSLTVQCISPSYCSYSTDFENIHDDTYMIGYWESEKIFAGIKDFVRSRFKFAPECFNSKFLRDITACNSVALHVRIEEKTVTAEIS